MEHLTNETLARLVQPHGLKRRLGVKGTDNRALKA